MADLVITPANVTQTTSDTGTNNVQAGEVVAAGEAVYLASDGKWYRAVSGAGAADAQNEVKAGSRQLGIALTGATAADRYFIVVTSGALELGAVLTVGVAYIVSTNAGKIAPATDFSGYASDVHLSLLGLARTTSELALIYEPVLYTQP